jgi:hypothetical protein
MKIKDKNQKNILKLETNIKDLLVGRFEEILNKPNNYDEKNKSFLNHCNLITQNYKDFSEYLLFDITKIKSNIKFNSEEHFLHFYLPVLQDALSNVNLASVKPIGLFNAKEVLIGAKTGQLLKIFDFLKGVSGMGSKEKNHSLSEYQLILEQFQYYLEKPSDEVKIKGLEDYAKYLMVDRLVDNFKSTSEELKKVKNHVNIAEINIHNGINFSKFLLGKQYNNYLGFAHLCVGYTVTVKNWANLFLKNKIEYNEFYEDSSRVLESLKHTQLPIIFGYLKKVSKVKNRAYNSILQDFVSHLDSKPSNT